MNWDSGLLRLPEALEALTIVETFLAAADGRLVGAEEVRSPRPRRTEFIPFRSILSPRNGKVEFTPFRKRSPDRATVERSGFACFWRLTAEKRKGRASNSGLAGHGPGVKKRNEFRSTADVLRAVR